MDDPKLKKTLSRLENMPTPFATYGTAFLSDAMQKLGLQNRVLEPAIRPLLPYTRMAGTAITIKLEFASKPDTESVLESYARAFDAAKDVNSPILAIEMPFCKFGALGSGGARVMKHRYGFAGCVVDGVVRDTDELARMNLPVFYRYIHPEYVDGILRGASTNESIVAGGVCVNPGDIIVGDNDGVVAIPREQLYKVMDVVSEIMKVEEEILREIDEGMPYLEVGRKHLAELMGKVKC